MTRRPNETPPCRIGPLIRRYRDARGMTQRELAAAAGLSLGALRDLEQGRTTWPQWVTVEGLIAAVSDGPHQRAELTRAWRADSRRAGAPAGRRRISTGAELHIDVLGPLTARREGRQMALGSVRQQAVLGLLALHHGTSVPRDAIVDALWGDGPPASAVTEVQGYVSRLRKLIRSADDGGGPGGVLATTVTGYRLDAEADQLDLAVFEQLTQHAEQAAARGDVPGACGLYGQALDLWRGAPLADVSLLGAHPAVTSLKCRRADAIVRYAEIAARSGAHARVLPHLRDLCNTENFNEQAHAHLMIALAACGQQAAALSVFGELRRRLDKELGMPPGPQVAQAHIRVLRQEAGRPGSG